ncbi:MAG: glycoside hydrolase family 3 protein [Vicinamibacterales bacterium]
MRRLVPVLALAAAAALALAQAAPLAAVEAQGQRARQGRRPAAPPPPPARPAFAATLDREAARWVEATLASLSDEQLVGQLLVGRFDSTYLSADSAAFDDLASLVRDVHVGGFVAFGGVEPVPNVLLNPTYGAVILGQPLELAALANRLQALAATPLLIGADFEHGAGMRLNGATRFPRAMAFGAAGDPVLVRDAGRLTAREARALGVHMDFAPVADVNNNPLNPVINIRSFGEDPERVGALAAEAVRGLQEGGVIATLKHFPGHGDTNVDTHLGLATVPHDRARLDRVELAPFRAGIAAGAGAVMVAHVEMPALDPAPGPATFSAPIVTGLLRRTLGFEGLVATDSLRMDAIAAMTGPGEAAVKAVQAGADVILDPSDVRAAAAAMTAALATGTLPRARLVDSVRRVLQYKARLGLHRSRAVDLDAVMTDVGTRPAADLARTVAERAVTLLRDEPASVPLALPSTARVLYLSVLDYPSGWSIAAPSRTVIPELRARWPAVTAVEVSDRSSAAELDLVRAMAGGYDAVVAGVFVRASSGSGRLELAPGLVRLLSDLSGAAVRRHQPLVGVFFGSPYAAAAATALPAVLLTYDFGDYAEAAAVRALSGEIPIRGRLPVALGSSLPVGFGLDRPAAARSGGR